MPVNQPDTALEEHDFADVEKYCQLAGLPPIGIAIMIALVSDHVSDSPRTGSVIADDLGIHENTVYKYRRNPLFNRLHAQILREIFQGNLDRVYKGMMIGVDKGNTGMVKLALEHSGEYVQQFRNVNVNLNRNVSALDTQPLDIDTAAERFLSMLGTRGWSLEMVVDLWHRLKREQAF
jgi:hypothetical protein